MLDFLGRKMNEIELTRFAHIPVRHEEDLDGPENFFEISLLPSEIVWRIIYVEAPLCV